MKKILMLVISILSFCSVHAQTDREIIDSLQKVAYSLPHDTTRLKILKNITISEQYSPNFMKWADELLAEAQLQNQYSFMCDAAYYHALYHYNFTEEHDSISKWVEFIAPIAENIGYWSIYFNAHKVLINSHIYNEDFEFALNEAMKMLNKAQEIGSVNGLISSYICMANAYSETNRTKRKEESLLKAYQYISEIKSTDIKMDIYEQLIEHYEHIGDYQILGKYLDEYLNELTKVTQSSVTLQNAYPSHFFYINTYYICYYVGIGDLVKAREQIDITRNSFTENIFQPYGILLHRACAKYQLALKNYQMAINHTDSAIDIEATYGVSTKIRIELLRLKADILTDKSAYNEALPIYEQSKHLRDSLNKVISEKQFNQIKEIYELDKLQQEQLKLRRMISNTILSIVFITLIVSTLYMNRMRRINKKLRESEKATKEAAERTEQANDEKSRFLSNMSHAIRVPLHSVVGFSNLLVSEEDLSEEERSEYAQITQKQSDKLIRLVNNILDLSRLEANRMKWKLEDIDIVHLCNDIVKDIRFRNDKIRIVFDCEVSEAIVHTDLSRLQNLISTMLYNPFNTSKEDKVVFFHMAKVDNNVEISVVNSPLLDSDNAGEENDIQHQFNRLLIQYFQGEYEILPQTTAGPTIHFTYPIAQK